MALKLVQVRDCDGRCCVENPRFPNGDHSDCIYHIPGTLGKENAGCQLMLDKSLVIDESKKMKDKMFDGWTSRKLFEETCEKWPQNTPLNKQFIDATGGCCWKWVNDGN